MKRKSEITQENKPPLMEVKKQHDLEPKLI